MGEKKGYLAVTSSYVHLHSRGNLFYMMIGVHLNRTHVSWSVIRKHSIGSRIKTCYVTFCNQMRENMQFAGDQLCNHLDKALIHSFSGSMYRAATEISKMHYAAPDADQTRQRFGSG